MGTTISTLNIYHNKYYSLIMLIPLIFCFCNLNSNAQSYIVNDKIISLNYGLFPVFYNTSHNFKTTINPISANFDFALLEHSFYGVIGIGGFAAFGKSKSEYSSNAQLYGTKYTNYIFGIQGKYHFLIKKHIDIYGGLMFGYFFTQTHKYGISNYNLPKDHFNEIIWYAHVGLRYYPPRKYMGFNIEVGYGFTIINFGLCYKLIFHSLPFKKIH